MLAPRGAGAGTPMAASVPAGLELRTIALESASALHPTAPIQADRQRVALGGGAAGISRVSKGARYEFSMEDSGYIFRRTAVSRRRGGSRPGPKIARAT